MIDNYQKDTVIQALPTLAYVNRAKKFIEKNQFVEAEGLLLKALEISQKDSLVYKYLGLVYEKIGNFNLAVENYQKSADLNSNDKNIWQRLGFSLISAKKYEQAVNAFENSNKIQPNNTDTFTGWGMALTKLQDFQGAHEKFLMAITINKYNLSALFLAAISEIKLKIYDKAEEKLLFLMNATPNEVNTYEYARLKFLKNDVDNAIFYASKSVTLNPNMLPAYMLLGQAYTKKQDKNAALNSFKTAFEKGLKIPEFWLEWAKSLIFFENYADAYEKLSGVKDKFSDDNYDFMFNYALSSVLTDNFDIIHKLIDNFKDAENRSFDLVLGIYEYKTQKYESAMKHLKIAAENSISSFYLAKCYEILDDDLKVRECFETSLRYNEQSLNTYVNYVNYLVTKQDYKEAKRKLRKALKYYPDDICLLNLMFYTGYILVKDDFSEYNIKEVISIANKIENLGTDLFEYPRQKQELINLLSESE